MKYEKTVYILGAGASKAVNLPLQTEILPKIFSVEPPQAEFNEEVSFLDLPIDDEFQIFYILYPEFNKCRLALSKFIVDNFTSQSKLLEFKILYKTAINHLEYESANNVYLFKALDIAKNVSVTLEDLFTIFDKTAVGHEHFRLYSPRELEEVHSALRKCIVYVLAHEMKVQEHHNGAYKRLAQKLIQERLSVSQKADAMSVITTNWDTALEKELYKQCIELNKSAKKQKVYPDLCFYDYAFCEDEKRIVSTHVKAKGHKNIKYLKMHGSINWLGCPYCGRVFVDYKNDIALKELSPENYCPYCSTDIGLDEVYQPELRPMIITPSFMKELNNLHIKNIWHNAFIDITEATNIIFIGYSFPDADFEMRCLLKKAVRPKAKIHVILSEFDNPDLYIKKLVEHNFPEETLNLYLPRLNLPQYRYENFFDKENVTFSYNGIEGFLNES